MFAAADTTSTVPWWYVAALAGGFTLLGVLVSLLASWGIAKRKNRLDDHRRFDGDLIQAYIDLDHITDILHNNAGGDPIKEEKVYWKTYKRVIAIVTRLELIASPRVYGIAQEMQGVVMHMRPSNTRADGPGMPDLVDSLEELRQVLRKELRVERRRQSPLQERLRGLRLWFTSAEFRSLSKFERSGRI